MSMILLSNLAPDSHETSFASETIRKMHILQNEKYDFWSIGDPRRDNFVGILGFSTKSGYPLLGAIGETR